MDDCGRRCAIVPEEMTEMNTLGDDHNATKMTEVNTFGDDHNVTKMTEMTNTWIA